MAKNISLLCAILALLAVATLLLDYQIKPEMRTLEDISKDSGVPLRQAPDFTFTDINGQSSKLSTLRGKIVILHFWATWCAPCLVELPKLTQIAAANKDKLVVLAVSSDDELAVLKHFTSRQKIPLNFHVIWDRKRTITHDTFQTFSYPETIMIDGNGQMVRKIPGDADWTGEKMKSYLDELMVALANSGGKP